MGWAKTISTFLLPSFDGYPAWSSASEQSEKYLDPAQFNELSLDWRAQREPHSYFHYGSEGVSCNADSRDGSPDLMSALLPVQRIVNGWRFLHVDRQIDAIP